MPNHHADKLGGMSLNDQAVTEQAVDGFNSQPATDAAMTVATNGSARTIGGSSDPPAEGADTSAMPKQSAVAEDLPAAAMHELEAEVVPRAEETGADTVASSSAVIELDPRVQPPPPHFEHASSDSEDCGAVLPTSIGTTTPDAVVQSAPSAFAAVREADAGPAAPATDISAPVETPQCSATAAQQPEVRVRRHIIEIKHVFAK